MFIHHGNERGGAAISLLFLVKSLQSLGHQTLIVNTLGSNEVDELYSSHGIETVSARVRYFPHTTAGSWDVCSARDMYDLAKWLLMLPVACLNLYRVIRNYNPDVVHLNSVTLFPYLSFLRWLRVPTVLHIRESAVEGRFGLRLGWCQRAIKKNANHVISICEDNARAFGVEGENTSVILNPVDIEKFNCHLNRNTCREELGIPVYAPVALFSGGSNSLIKGVLDFAEAMKQLKTVIPDLVCLFPSGVSELKRHPEIAEAMLKLGDDLVTCGFTFEIEKWLCAADVVYVLHKTPHFSRTLLEAATMKRPSIAYQIGGLTDVINSSLGGVLVECNAINSVVDESVRMFEDELLRQKYADNGYRWVLGNCTAAAHAFDVVEVYKKINE
jgi:glycosyltransferase involved in cell wall biosynthesis